MNILTKKRFRQSGAVSLFIVIFSALLMTVVTISFVQLMVKDQQQATASDLSQSAYDSAQAGVEDAKRLLLLDQSCRNNTAAPSVNCPIIAAALTPAPGKPDTDCNTLAKSGIVGETNNETIVQQNIGDNSAKLDQAYTCVKLAVNTDSYLGKADLNGSSIVPLQGVSNFDSIEVSWFSSTDVAANTGNPTVGFPTVGSDVSLPQVGTRWQANYPALMRAQLMQTGTNFTLSDFDDSQPGNRSNANTLFLYPSATGLSNLSFALDARRSPTNTPQQAKCNTSFLNGQYACTTTIQVPSPIDGNIANRQAFLRLSAFYNGAHFQIRLKQGASYVQFANVQPIVDSTGRANNMFRRVQARVELKGIATYPDATLSIAGDLCKNFTVTNDESGFSNNSSCTP